METSVEISLETNELGLLEVNEARQRLEGAAFETWIFRSRHFDENAGCYCFFKAENMQRSGSIQFRGVFNRIKYESEKRRIRRIITHAPEDFSLAVALSAKLMGIPSILVLPEEVSPEVLSAAQSYGTEVFIQDFLQNNSGAIIKRLEVTEEDLLMSPKKDRILAAGEATAVAELLEEIPDVDVVILPSSDEQLLAYSLAISRASKHPVEVYGAEEYQVLRSHRYSVGPVTILHPTGEQMANAQIFLLQRLKILVGTHSCAAAAAVLHHHQPLVGKKVGILLTSGNVPLQVLGASLRQSHTLINKKMSEYTVQCYTCRESFNATDAVWCNCLSAERSLVCPRCFNCFCTAPREYKQKFWDSAPQQLWNRLMQEHDQYLGLERNPSPYEVKRPLVLIVEPDKQIQRMAKRIVEGLGYGAILAEDGQRGFLLTQQYLPNVVLTAALMPKMDGREMCRKIKENPPTSKTKVAVMTALYTQQKYRSEAFKRFLVDEYVIKPIKMRDLQSILQKFLDS